MSFSTRKTTLMVVDDDLVSRMALGGLLKRIPDTKIVEAEDGLQAWNLLEDGARPSLVCSDIQMPNMNGLELLQKIRNHPIFSQIPVVLVSGDARREVIHAAMSSRPAGYIVKPFAGEETRATVKRILRGNRDSQAERTDDSIRRLNQSAMGLKAMADVLIESIDAEIMLLDTNADPERRARLARLHSGCLILGLWRAAKVLVASEMEGVDLPMLHAILTETKTLAAEQRDRHAAQAVLQAQEATL